MRAAAALVATLFACAPAAADRPARALQPWTHPFLWRIEGARPSYLVGTMHLPDPRVAHLPPALQAALAETDAVMLELPLDWGTQLVAALRMIGPPGDQLRDVAPPALLARMKKLVEKSGASWGVMERLRPVAATMLLGMQTGGAVGAGTFVDQALWDWARDHGKEHGGIETVDEQLALVEGASRADQLTLLEEAVTQAEKGEADDAFEPLRAAYFSGDEKRALALIAGDKSSPASERLEHRMIDERNVRMAERIAARLRSGPPTVYAVGLAHVVGKNGIVARLQHAGFHVTRVR